MRRDLEVRKRVSGPNHPDTLSAMVNLALDYMEGNRLPDAEGLLRDVIDADRKVLGPDHMDTTYSMEKLGLVLMREEKWGEAEKMLRASLASYERAVGPSDYFTGRARLDLIQLYMKSGETRKMDEAIREAIRVSPNLIMLNQASWAYLTVNPASARRPREALELARRCVKLAPEDPDVLNTVVWRRCATVCGMRRSGRLRRPHLSIAARARQIISFSHSPTTAAETRRTPIPITSAAQDWRWPPPRTKRRKRSGGKPQSSWANRSLLHLKAGEQAHNKPMIEINANLTPPVNSLIRSLASVSKLTPGHLIRRPGSEYSVRQLSPAHQGRGAR